MRFSVETWAPEYGIGADADQLEDVSERVEVELERDVGDWAPIVPSPESVPDSIMFIDGVRRIDARVWIHHDDGSHAGVCASYAAGAVTCRGATAEVTAVEVGRGLFAAATSGAGPVVTRHATYAFAPTADETPEASYLAIHERMTSLELGVSAGHDCELVVFDGPLRGRNDPHGVGYVKTQHVQYLPEPVAPILAALDDGQRTPLFLVSGRGFTRYSWYLRLPGPRNQPLSGIVRLELPGVGTVADAVERAEVVSAALPRFASEAHKESRAPQNLYPIAGLEHRLRHRLGDALLLERSLRLAAAS
ncbi:MAG: hypothetical protein RIE08_08865 [Acidimicrobiales bacterium]